MPVAIRVTPSEARRLGVAHGGDSRWSRAEPTVIDGIRFPSKMQARVYQRLKAELRPGWRLSLEVRFPLLALPPDARGRVLYFTPDFVLMAPSASVPLSEWRVVIQDSGWAMRVIEAKGRRRSRDYEVRKRAFEATYQVHVEEVER